jgi:hypothetical protein
VIGYLDADPDNNVPKILNWLIKSDNRFVAPQAKAVQDVLGSKDSNWHRLVDSLWTDIDDGVRRRIFENLIINASFWEANDRKKTEKHSAVIFHGRF